jgi:hypothetical protein
MGDAVVLMVFVRSLHEGVVVKAEYLQVILQLLQILDRFL